MITPKQVTDPHTGHHLSGKRRSRQDEDGKGKRKPPRRFEPPTPRDPLFDALRAELGL